MVLGRAGSVGRVFGMMSGKTPYEKGKQSGFPHYLFVVLPSIIHMHENPTAGGGSAIDHVDCPPSKYVRHCNCGGVLPLLSSLEVPLGVT